MKKLLITVALLLAAFCSGGCAAGSEAPGDHLSESLRQEPERLEVAVFAAASMEAAMTQIAELYKQDVPNVDLVFTFDSSGTLKTQIQEGAVCDLFISAAQKQMNQLDAADTTGANNENLDFVFSDTRVDLLENKVVLAVSEKNSGRIKSFRDLGNAELLCLGNGNVPVGSYSVEILKNLGIDLQRLEADGSVTYASNVSEVATQIKEGMVDCGIIYATDAATYQLKVVDQADEQMCSRVIYPAAIMKSGTRSSVEAAQAFLDYIHINENAVKILEDIGFTVLK